MKRIVAVAATAATVVLATTTTAHASKPVSSCPPGAWQQSVFPLGWQPGDATDPTGQNLATQIGIAGAIEEFGSLAAALAAFGFVSFTDFYAAVVDPDYNTIDRNDDGALCIKTFPVTPGRPAFLVLAIDNAVSG